MSAADIRDNHIRQLAGQWARQLAEVVESMTGQAPEVEWGRSTQAADQPNAEQAVWWMQPLNLAPQAWIAIATPEAAWLGIGSRSLQMAGIEEVGRDDARSTYLEILQQAFGSFAQWLSGLVGREVTCEKGSPVAPAEVAAEILSVKLAFPDEALPALEVGLSGALLEAVLPALPGQTEPARRTASGQPGSGAEIPKTLDLLLDVELPVSVSFGRAKLPLKDVIKLTTGSIVELNRTVTEPVEVIVNNCVIARGEVVVVEGNYGIKITQIVSRQERLRTLS